MTILSAYADCVLFTKYYILTIYHPSEISAYLPAGFLQAEIFHRVAIFTIVIGITH